MISSLELLDFGITDPYDEKKSDSTKDPDTFINTAYDSQRYVPISNRMNLHYAIEFANKSASPYLNNIIGMGYSSEVINPQEAPNELVASLDVEVLKVEDAPADYCKECKVALKILEDVMICSECGIEVELNAEYNPEVYNSTIDGNYNSSTTASTSFTFSGKKSYGYQKAILKSCSDYSATSYQMIKKEILHRINLYEGNKPPMNVQLNCIDLYYSIKENNKSYLNIINQGVAEQNEKKRLVFRSNGKWGIIAACLYYSCIEEGLARTPREISEIIGIDEKYQSAGDKKLQEFYELGIINIPINGKLLDDYIGRYFPLLGVPDKYKQFIVDLLNRADQKGLNICNDTRASTKCIGAIMILCARVPELRHISRDIIARECHLSKSTFVKYAYTLLNNWPVLKKVFKMHQIPMPQTWRGK